MDGVLIINKEKGFTSHDIVNILRKELHIKKIGHTGTLDPNATGVLPILVGKATKISKYLIEHNKVYVAELLLGKKSSTGDIEGEIIEEQKVPVLTKEQIESVLQSFKGKQMQTPPIYSSIKINGKKAYEYARKGENIKLESREIEIYNIELINYTKNIINFKVECSKGTYIRVLCEDIANKLATVGLMNNLQRIRVNQFDIKDSLTIEQLKEKQELPYISIEEIFRDKKKITLSDAKTKFFLNGVKLSINEKDDLYCIYNNNIFLGLGIVEDNLLKRDIIVI